MEVEKKPCCGDCVFWDVKEKTILHYGKNEIQSECHRYPPKFSDRTWVSVNGLTTLLPGSARYTFPLVMNDNWCEEFKRG